MEKTNNKNPKTASYLLEEFFIDDPNFGRTREEVINYIKSLERNEALVLVAKMGIRLGLSNWWSDQENFKAFYEALK